MMHENKEEALRMMGAKKTVALRKIETIDTFGHIMRKDNLKYLILERYTECKTNGGKYLEA